MPRPRGRRAGCPLPVTTWPGTVTQTLVEPERRPSGLTAWIGRGAAPERHTGSSYRPSESVRVATTLSETHAPGIGEPSRRLTVPFTVP